MKINLDQHSEPSMVAAYDTGWIRVGGRQVSEPCVVSVNDTYLDWLPPSVDALTAEHFAPIIKLTPEIVLLGTGKRQIFVDYKITEALADRGIALEVMDTGAACRSFNILLGEARSVVAALYMI